MNLREYRKSPGLTLEEAQALIGINRDIIRHVEIGEYKYLNEKMREAFRTAYGKDADSMIAESYINPPKTTKRKGDGIMNTTSKTASGSPKRQYRKQSPYWKSSKKYKGRYSIALYDDDGLLAALFDTVEEFARYSGRTKQQAWCVLTATTSGRHKAIIVKGFKLKVELLEN